MFACRHSSLTAPLTRITRQTTLDAHRCPKPQMAKKDMAKKDMAKKDMGLRPHSAAKGKKKDAEEGPQQDRTSVSGDGSSSAGEVEVEVDSPPKIMVHDADKARAFLEKELVIESGMEL